jgi:hypothetical protein
MELGPIPDYLKHGMRKRFLAGLKGSRSLDTYELDLFRWFKTETEDMWAQMEAEEKRYLQEQIDAGDEEPNDSGMVAVDYYRKRTRSSHIMFLASLLESAMKRECERVSLALGDQILFKTSDLKGNPWSVRKLFLERYGSFHISGELWDPIREILAVRNALAHHNGVVSLLTNEQLSTLGKIGGVSVGGSEVEIQISYIESASNSVRKLMEFLHEQVNHMIDRAIRPHTL